MKQADGIVEMMTGIADLGFLLVAGLFLIYVVLPAFEYISKKFRGYRV